VCASVCEIRHTVKPVHTRLRFMYSKLTCRGSERYLYTIRMPSMRSINDMYLPL